MKLQYLFVIIKSQLLRKVRDETDKSEWEKWTTMAKHVYISF